MQTKPKQKLTAILIAFTMILTTMIQLCIPITVHAEDIERTLTFTSHSTLTSKNNSDIVNDSKSVMTVTGNGHFVAKTISFHDTEKMTFGANTYIVSDKTFNATVNYSDSNGTNSSYNATVFTKNNIYYAVLGFSGGSCNDTNGWDYAFFGTINETTYNSESAFNNAVEEFLTNVDTSKDDYEEKTFDEDNASYSSDIPTPKISVNKKYDITFNNCTDEYFFQLKGRWYSVDDIELYKENAQWLYKYNSIIKNSLSEWTNNIQANTKELNLATLGKDSFDNLLALYPIESRSYTGGTNALGNYFSGYNDALSTLKMLLGQQTTFYNGIEIYVRYYTYDDNNNIIYGKWCHYYDDLANASGSNGVIDDYLHNEDKDLHNGYQSEIGLTDKEQQQLEDSNISKSDTDIVADANNRYDTQKVDLTSLTDSLELLINQGKSIINLFATVFSFLPNWLLALIASSFALCCVLGLWKIIRG